MYDNTYQPYDELNSIALVNKYMYTKQWGNFIFSPGLKYRMYKKARSESVQPLKHYLMRIPLVMFNYILSPNTKVMFGLQGLPGYDLKYTDYIMNQNNYRKNIYMLQLQNRSDYLGYLVFATAGVSLEKFKYDIPYRKMENYKSSMLHVNVHIGW